MNSGPILTIGSTGVDVRRLQTILVMTKLLDYTGIDGNFGPKTQDAVKSFQQTSNLTPDGIVGQRRGTRCRRMRIRRIWRAAQPAPPYPPCKKGCWRLVVATAQPTPARSMGSSARRLNLLCAAIKPSMIWLWMGSSGIGRGGCPPEGRARRSSSVRWPWSPQELLPLNILRSVAPAPANPTCNSRRRG